jgi:hypothetical protein
MENIANILVHPAHGMIGDAITFTLVVAAIAMAIAVFAMAIGKHIMDVYYFVDEEDEQPVYAAPAPDPDEWDEDDFLKRTEGGWVKQQSGIRKNIPAHPEISLEIEE